MLIGTKQTSEVIENLDHSLSTSFSRCQKLCCIPGANYLDGVLSSDVTISKNLKIAGVPQTHLFAVHTWRFSNVKKHIVWRPAMELSIGASFRVGKHLVVPGVVLDIS